MASITLDELRQEAEKQGVPQEAVSAWYQGDGPSKLTGQSAAQVVQGIGMATNAATTGKIQLPTQTVSVTGQRPRLPTTVNPYAGTAQEARNPDNPNAAAISQFDPEALKAAQEAYNRMFKEQSLGRGITQAIAGFGAGSAGTAADRLGWEARNKELYDQSVGAQKRLQEQATAGEAALTSAQAREEAAGKFMGTQREMQNKLDMQKFDVKTREAMNDPSSPQTLMAAMMLADQARAAGTPLPADLQKMIADKKVTAEQLIGFMDPKVLEAYKTKVGINKVAQEAEKIAIENKFGRAGVGKYVVPKEEQAAADRESLRIIKSEYDKETDPEAKAALFREMIRLEQSIKVPTDTLRTGAGGTQSTFQAGPVSVSPSQGAQAESTAAAADRTRSAEQFKTYNAVVKPDIDATLSLLNKTYTGKGAAALAAWVPGDNAQAEVASRLAALNQTYPDALPPEVSANLKAQASKPGFNGTFQLSMSPGQSIKLLQEAKARVERLESYRTQQSKFEDRGGRPSDFYKTEGAKKATSAPETVTLRKGNRTITIPKAQEEEARADGFR
jgi:hypothetical protein